MFSRIQTRGFRSLRAIDQTLGPFQALVGPNATGKTTFLDVMGFLGDLIRNRGEVLETVNGRSSNFQNLLWKGEGDTFQLAVEAPIPDRLRSEIAEDKQRYSHVRYEIEIGLDSDSNEVGLNHEVLWLREVHPRREGMLRPLFPDPTRVMMDLQTHSQRSFRKAITKKPGGNDNYYTEGKKKSYMPSFRLGRTKAALANLPADRESFPISSWFRDLLEKGVQNFVLNSQIIRQPSPPGLGRRFQMDGSNLPWVVAELRKEPKKFRAWLDHVRTSLDDVVNIDTVEQPENKHRYLVIQYSNGAKVPSWLASDGTLRLLALTIPAYLGDQQGVFLIEEPENGIHPRAIETVLQSLSSMYGSQVLIATHSPVALNLLEPKQVLCFAKDDLGATDIVLGSEHPALQDWKHGQPDIGVLFAAGILS